MPPAPPEELQVGQSVGKRIDPPFSRRVRPKDKGEHRKIGLEGAPVVFTNPFVDATTPIQAKKPLDNLQCVDRGRVPQFVKSFFVLVRYYLLTDPFQNNIRELRLSAGYPEAMPLMSLLQKIRRCEKNPTFNTVLRYNIQDHENRFLFINVMKNEVEAPFSIMNQLNDSDLATIAN